MENTKILIEVRGGIVQAIGSNNPNVKVVIVDYDNINDDYPEPVQLNEHEPDYVEDNLHDRFKSPENQTETEILGELKRLNF